MNINDNSLTSEPQSLEQTVRSWLYLNRRLVLWVVCLAFVAWIAIAVQEVVALLLLAYGIATLLEPVVARLERKGVSRTSSIIGFGTFLLLLLGLLLVLAIPAIIKQYDLLITELPNYIKSFRGELDSAAIAWFGLSLPEAINTLIESAKAQLSNVNASQLQKLFGTVTDTVLQGYSLTLTIVNLTLLPFFVFYLSRDYHLFHQVLAGFLEPEQRSKVSKIGNEILGHVYAFFKGQLLVALLLALLYSIGLSIVGLPFAIAVGTIAGLLNIVPYLGLGLGLIISVILTAVSDPTLMQFVWVGLVFAIVQFIEGTFVTPKVVGESVGIHPLGVMLALIVGGSLLGLIGLIIAIPAAAGLRVLFRNTLEMLDLN